MKKNVVVRNVRLADELIRYLDARALRTGRTRNAELIALLEKAMVEVKCAVGYLSSDSDKISGDENLIKAGGGSYQIRIPFHLDQVILNDISFQCYLEECIRTYSDKIRYLLCRGLFSRGDVIVVDLESLNGSVFQDEQIDSIFVGLKVNESLSLEREFCLSRNFEDLMLNTQGHVLVHGATGTGKSFSAGYYKASNQGGCHYLDLNAEQCGEMKSRQIILLWSNTKRYIEMKTLVLDDAHHLDSEYLTLFLTTARKKNVRVILTCQSESDLEEDVFQQISHNLNFNYDANGRPLWYAQVGV